MTRAGPSSKMTVSRNLKEGRKSHACLNRGSHVEGRASAKVLKHSGEWMEGMTGADGAQTGQGEEGSDGQRMGTVGRQCSGMVGTLGFTEVEWTSRAYYSILKMEK